jgi:hypothetical protein
MMVGGLLLPGVASAQSVTSFAALGNVLEAGQKISVEREDGRITVGRFSSISDGELRMEAKALMSGRQEAFTAESIRRVRAIDSLKNGMLAGVGGGLVAAGLLAATADIGNPDVTREIMFASAAVLTIPIGIGMGAIVDHAINRTAFQRLPRATLRLTPLVGARAGVLASLAF